MLTMYKMHHPKADIDRLYVKRKWRTSGEKYMGKKFNIMERWAG